MFQNLTPHPILTPWWVGDSEQVFSMQTGYFMQLLAKKIFLWTDLQLTPMKNGSWWTWVLNTNLDLLFNSWQKQLWLETEPQPTPIRVGVLQIWRGTLSPPHLKEGWCFANMTSQYSSGHFMLFLANTFLLNLPHLTLQEVRVGKNYISCADLDIPCTFHQNKFLMKLLLTPLPIGVGASNLHSMHFWTFNAISNNFFCEFGPTFTCWRGNPYHSWESHLSITLYRESKTCDLVIIFGRLLQISRTTICRPRHFL